MISHSNLSPFFLAHVSSYRDVTHVNVADANVPLTDQIKSLEVTLDSHCTFDTVIRPAINDDMAKLFACSPVGSRRMSGCQIRHSQFVGSYLYTSLTPLAADQVEDPTQDRNARVWSSFGGGSKLFVWFDLSLCSASFTPFICRQSVNRPTS